MLPVVVVKVAPLASDISVRGGGRTRCTGEHLWIHDVGGDVTPVRTGRDGEPDVVGMPDARRGDVELPMRKARRVEADADATRAVGQLSGTVRCLCQTSCQVLSVLRCSG